MGTNGTYICDKHDNVVRWTLAARRHALNLQTGGGSPEDVDRLLELLTSIEYETLAAKRDGQRMEDRLVERAVQGDALAAIATGLSAVANNLENYLNIKVNE